MFTSNWESWLNNYTNWILLFIFLFILYETLRPLPKLPEPKRPKVVELKKFTPKELSKFNGQNGSSIYLAVKGKVFDVTGNARFYGPGSPYENFAGRDASRGLAKHSFDLDMLTPLDQPIDTLEDLLKDEIQTLNDWYQSFSGKYQHVGWLKNPSE